ncbi:hypothetical protein BEP19_08715 [Ammoniphilus oxalaticus]|uniref:DUF3231 family protein n=1 Tax=Ammoniphilus oxalaticus TaxID=66863 RepID=A0A419SKI3_9BACL|nr:DUF3231 family protein [Ammoniphilus oxalaticus]RKD24459.1 hypothetical protein BEP19_08715 [Ammoniphilus oxalaticus]
MTEHRTRLTASEVAALWGSYQSNTMAVCIFNYFLHHVDDSEVRELLEYTLTMTENDVKKIKRIIQQANHPLPIGFTEADVNVKAPRLYSNAIYLYYIKNMTKIAIATYGVSLAAAVNSAVRDFLSSGIIEATHLYNKAAELLLQKGLYIRTPYIVTPNTLDFVSEQNYLGGILNMNPRPLNAIEITHLQANTQTNTIGQFLMMGFSQVAENKKVRQYLMRGVDISKKHVKVLNSILVEDNLPAPVAWDLDVSDSTVAPFSDKLMLFHTTALIASGISNYATSSAASLRLDIATTYTRLTGEIARYAIDGTKLMIENSWLEEPPQNIDRKEVANV